MTGPHRLPPTGPGRFGTEIDRDEPVGFRYAGGPRAGFYGDTLASALLASGETVFGASHRLGRPRGLMALSADDPCGLAFAAAAGPGAAAPAAEILLREGMALQTADRRAGRPWAGRLQSGAEPSPGPEGRLLPASQRLLERLRRHLPLPAPRLAELSAPPAGRREFCDVLIIGAGLAGLAAAEAALSAGLGVVVLEASWRAGGMADLYPGAVGGVPLKAWAENQAARLRERGALILRATAIAIGPDGAVTAIERVEGQRPAVGIFAARAVVVATGWRERPLVFADNDRPGIMLASAARALLRRHAAAPGRRVIVATACDEGYRTAMDLKEAGVTVEMVLDCRENPQGPAVDMAKALGTPVSFASIVSGVRFDERERRLTGVHARNRFGEGVTAGARSFDADALIVSGGFAPRDELVRACRLTEEHGVFSAFWGPDAVEAVASGHAAGLAAARTAGGSPVGEAPEVDATRDEAGEAPAAYLDRLTPEAARTAFVDFGADVTLADLVQARDRGVSGPGALSRWLGIGSGADNGRLGAALVAAAHAELGGDAAAFRAPPPGRATLGQLAARARLSGG
jgi:sarcosine oxidase subunit alpha